MGQVLELPTRRRQHQNTENGKVAPPHRRPNKELRTREYLTPNETDALITASRSYEAGVTVMQSLKSMSQSALNIGA